MSTRRTQQIVPSKAKETAKRVEQIHKSPLDLAELKRVLARLAKLGLQWTADLPPRLRPVSTNDNAALRSAEFNQIVTLYPHLPLEVAALILFVVTGTKPDKKLVGSVSDLAKKSELIKSTIVTADYKSEFFFENAIKLQKLCGLDWEVVIKTYEKDVSGIPACPYAIFSLTLHKSENSEHKHVTFATDIRGIRRLKKALSEVEEQFDTAVKLADKLVGRR